MPGRCGSDITLGDFWGVENVFQELNDDKGTSLVLVNTAKGAAVLKQTDAILIETQYETVVKYNSSIEKCAPENKRREEFWSLYKKGYGLEKPVNAIIRKQQPTIFKRFLHRLNRMFKTKL